MVIPVTYYVLEILFARTIYQKSSKSVEEEKKKNSTYEREKKIY